jgi:hypothetical protein
LRALCTICRMFACFDNVVYQLAVITHSPGRS